MATENTPDQPTFAAQVNEVVSKATVGEDGNLQLPEGVEVDENVMYAATLEKRRRDTQSAYSKSQSELAATRAENKTLTSSLQSHEVGKITAEQQEELDELKVTDPDAWRAKLNEIEGLNKTAFDQRMQEIRTQSAGVSEVEQRSLLLEAFTEANPDIKLTDDVIQNDIPPRYTNKLKNGDCSFEEFLADCKTYLTSDKVIGATEAPAEQPNLGDQPGGAEPDPEAVKNQSNSDYKTEIF